MASHTPSNCLSPKFLINTLRACHPLFSDVPFQNISINPSLLKSATNARLRWLDHPPISPKVKSVSNDNGFCAVALATPKSAHPNMTFITSFFISKSSKYLINFLFISRTMHPRPLTGLVSQNERLLFRPHKLATVHDDVQYASNRRNDCPQKPSQRPSHQ